MNKYEIGNIVNGYVSGIENYGVFINFDDSYNGLIHISEISDNYVKNINDYVNIGDNIRVKIIDVNHSNNQLKLSIKNIDYHIGNNSNSKIKETGLGFELLGKNLEHWINLKLK